MLPGISYKAKIKPSLIVISEEYGTTLTLGDVIIKEIFIYHLAYSQAHL